MNNQQFNQEQFNQDHFYAPSAEYTVSFNAFDLMSLCSETTGIAIQQANLHNLVAQLTSSESSQSDWGSIIDKRYSNKLITVTLVIQGSSNSDLISKIDDLKKNTQGVAGDFDILINGEIRRYAATVQSIIVPPFKKSVDFVEGIEMEMLITSPLWRYKDLASVYVQNQTADFTKVAENLGNYKAYPIIQVITNAGCDLTALSITMTKVWDVSWYTIGITEVIWPSSVIIFDFIAKKVTINDVEVNFTWVMMPLEVGQSQFAFDLTGTGLDVNAYILHYPTFL